jgi:hypothetical protein
MKYSPRCLSVPVCACALLFSGCRRASSFNLWGSFFPAWLVCATAGVLLAFAIHWLLGRFGIELALPVLAYPSLAALLTFALWLECFQ